MAEVIANSPTPGTTAQLTTLGAAITTTGQTSITTSAAPSSVISSLANGNFRALIGDGTQNSGAYEIVLFTAGQATTTCTVTRAVEGSTAYTWNNGTPIYHVWTALGMRQAVVTPLPAISPKSGSFFISPYLKGSGTNLADGTLYAWPIIFGIPITLTELDVKVTSAGGSASTIRVGVYLDNGAMYPGALLVDAGAIASGTNTGILTKTSIGQALSAGTVYWMAVAAQSQGGTAPTLTSTAAAYNYEPMGDPNSNSGFLFNGTYNAVVGYSMTGVSSTLPSTFSASVTAVVSGGGALIVGKAQ